MLKKILEFENFKSAIEIDKKLEQISKELFYNFNLVAGNNRYLITQVELFFSQCTNTELSTAKCSKHPYQMTHGKFHVHKTLKNNKLKSPKNIGLDITCGKEFDRYGGILLRGIKCVSTNQEIIGPSNVLNELIDNSETLNKGFSNDIQLKLFNLDGIDIHDSDILKLEKMRDHTPLFSDVKIDYLKATSRYSELFTHIVEQIKKAS